MSPDLIQVLPKDSSGNSFNRAMGVPLVSDSTILGSATKYVDIFDISQYPGRVFHGIMIENPSGVARVELGFTDAFGTDKSISIGPQALFTFDQQTFGSGFNDKSIAKEVTRIRAKLSLAVGVLATGTIDYSISGQPVNAMTVEINGTVYEFAGDASADPGRVRVDIGVDADASYTNLINAINAFDQSVTASIDTGLDVVTITSNYGGTMGNAIAINDGGVNPTGATFSGATLAGGSGGVTPIIHIW